MGLLHYRDSLDEGLCELGNVRIINCTETTMFVTIDHVIQIMVALNDCNMIDVIINDYAERPLTPRDVLTQLDIPSLDLNWDDKRHISLVMKASASSIYSLVQNVLAHADTLEGTP